MPLAIELAAARVEALGLEAVTLWAARAAQCRAAGVVEPPRPRPSTLPKLRLARGAVR